VERWCGVLVVVAVLLGARSATGSAITDPGPSWPASVLSAPLVAKASVSPLFPGFNSPVPSAPLRTFLNGSATGGTPPYRFAWDFGDGATSAVQNATHTYALPGTYAAVLTVTGGGGVTATSTIVAAATSTDGVPWVMGAADPGVGSVPLSVHFSVTGMGELPKSYDWAFGDGASSNSSEANHTYGRAGTFIARLNVTESDGANATYRMTVVVLSGGPLVALATATVVGLCYSDVWNRVNFQGLAGGGTPPYAFSWEFGEGNATSVLQNPTYSYSAPAWSHLSNLTVVDAMGLVATSTVSVLVFPPPCPLRAVLPWFVIVVAAVVAAVVVFAVALKRRRTSPPLQPPSPPAPPQ
jgi:PKD repeat protein